MSEEEIGKLVVDASMKVHTALGAGLLETIYEACLAKLGFLLNFNVVHMRDGIKRMVNGL